MVKTVLLTRAEDQNDGLAGLLREASIEPRIVPMLEIVDRTQDEQAKRVILGLDRYDHIVFVSRNAVRFGLAALEAWWPQWPVTLHWHAVGEATGKLLAARDIHAQVPEKHSTEGLLASGAFDDVAGSRILIVRGRGGRELLAQSLAARGADVDYLEVYERRPVLLDEQERRALLAQRPAVAVVYSGETLEALADNLGEVRKGLSIVVPSGRVGNVATALGFTDVIVAQGLIDTAILAAVRTALRGDTN